jgi:hypothetical protein
MVYKSSKSTNTDTTALDADRQIVDSAITARDAAWDTLQAADAALVIAQTNAENAQAAYEASQVALSNAAQQEGDDLKAILPDPPVPPPPTTGPPTAPGG